MEKNDYPLAILYIHGEIHDFINTLIALLIEPGESCGLWSNRILIYYTICNPNYKELDNYADHLGTLGLKSFHTPYTIDFENWREQMLVYMETRLKIQSETTW